MRITLKRFFPFTLIGIALSLSCFDFGPTGNDNDNDQPPEAPAVSNDPITGVWKPARISGSLLQASYTNMFDRKSSSVNDAPMTNPFPDSITESDASIYLSFGSAVCTVYVHYSGTEWYGRCISPVYPSPLGEGWSVALLDTVSASLRTVGINSTYKRAYRSGTDLVIDEMTNIADSSGMSMLTTYAYWVKADGEFPPADWPATVINVPLSASGLAKTRGVSGLVPSDQCQPRPCDCGDIPAIDAFKNAQNKNLEAWGKVRGDLFSGNPPTGVKDAKSRYSSYSAGGGNVMPACYSGTGRYELGAVSPSGGIMLDDCMCKNSCGIIVNSVALHEGAHVPMNVGHFFGTLPTKILAKAAGAASVSGWIDAADLTTAEIDCHTIQVDYLAAAQTALEISCLIESGSSLPKQRAVVIPATVADRARLLVSRMLSAFRVR